MKKAFVFWLFIFFYSFAKGQNLSGYVIDQETQDPLIGANILIKGTTQGNIANDEGYFSIPVIKFPVTLVVSYIGYQTKEISISKESSKLRILLSTDNTTLQEIQITDSRITEKQKQAAQTIEALDIIGIKQTASSDFYEGIGSMKAVDVTSASLGFKVINTRGFNSTSPVRSLQLIDGVDNQSPGLNFSLGNFLGTSELDVQKLELIAGANGAIYGPNAFNGVVYMATKDPFIHQGLSVSAKAGERNLREVGFRFARAFGPEKGKEKLAFKVNASYLSAYDWEANNLAPSTQSKEDIKNPGRYDAVNRYGDENLTEGQNNATSLSGQVQTPGLGRWYRTGYEEKDLVDYHTNNTKASAAIHYKIGQTRLIGASSFGSGTTIYQGDNRYSLKDIRFYQHRLEWKKEDKFFIRSYYTHEDAGKSYDAVFTALLLQNAAKSDVDWQKDYRNYWNSNVNSKITSLPGYPSWWNPFSGVPYPFNTLDSLLGNIQDSLFTYHQQAENYANQQNPLNPEDLDRFEPGTARFDSAFQSITSKKSFLEGGSGFYDKSALWHIQGEYIFEPSHDSVKILDIITGGSFRRYMPNSNGTIFNEVPMYDSTLSDTVFSKIINQEYGLYIGLRKKVIDEKITLSSTVRMDKNQNFDYLFSPSASAVYNLGVNHIFRISFSSAIRNPTLADQYLKYDVGRAILLGNINGYDSLVTTESLYNYFTDNLNTDTLSYFNVAPIRPEQVKTYELGYRGTLFDKVYVDLNYYYSFYNHFIGYTLGVDLTFDTLYTNRLTHAQAYRIASNASSTVTTQGFSVSANYFFLPKYSLNANYSWNKLNKKNADDPIIPAYNTPEHKFNVGISGNDLKMLQVPHIGFNINYKWIQGFIFEGSPQFTGYVPSYDMLDAQINWKWTKYKTFFKLGGSNLIGILPIFDKTLSAEARNAKIFQNKNMQVYGGPYIGRMLYFSVTIELDRL